MRWTLFILKMRLADGWPIFFSKGTTFMEDHGLLPSTSGYYTGYDDSINPSVSNDFTTAAFRVGHSQVQGSLQ